MNPKRGQDHEADIVLDDYFLPTGHLHEDQLLREWRWLIGATNPSDAARHRD
jgi:hypothetical protein